MKTFKLKCPSCGDESDFPMLDYLTKKPVNELPVGDFTLCPKCVTLCTVEEGGILHETTKDEVHDMPGAFWACIADSRAMYLAHNPDARHTAECPTCFNKMVGVGLGLKADFSIGQTGMCMACGSWVTIDDEKLNLRWASEEEVSAVPEEVRQVSECLYYKKNHNKRRY